MQSRIDTSTPPNYLTVRAVGIACAADYMSLWKDVLVLAEWRPGLPVLLDNRDRFMTARQTSLLVSAMADFYATNEDKMRKSRIASLVNDRANDEARKHNLDSTEWSEGRAGLPCAAK